REVAFHELLVLLALAVVHDVVHHGVDSLVVERVDVDAANVAVHPYHGRQPGGQVQVGGLVLDAESQQLGDVHPGSIRVSLGQLRTIMTSIAANLQQVRERLWRACEAASRDSAEVTLLAVSKTFGADAVRQAHAAGQTAFGENYVQEGIDKIAQVAQMLPREAIEWHCIGPLQSNKTRWVAEQFDWVQSVDRLKIAQRLSEQRPPGLPPLNVCL